MPGAPGDKLRRWKKRKLAGKVRGRGGRCGERADYQCVRGCVCVVCVCARVCLCETLGAMQRSVSLMMLMMLTATI